MHHDVCCPRLYETLSSTVQSLTSTLLISTLILLVVSNAHVSRVVDVSSVF